LAADLYFLSYDLMVKINTRGKWKDNLAAPIIIGPCHLSGIFLPLRVNSLPLPKRNLMSCALSSFLFPKEVFSPSKRNSLSLLLWLSFPARGGRLGRLGPSLQNQLSGSTRPSA
jgi:hypothetical protein